MVCQCRSEPLSQPGSAQNIWRWSHSAFLSAPYTVNPSLWFSTKHKIMIIYQLRFMVFVGTHFSALHVIHNSVKPPKDDLFLFTTIKFWDVKYRWIPYYSQRPAYLRTVSQYHNTTIPPYFYSCAIQTSFYINFNINLYRLGTWHVVSTWFSSNMVLFPKLNLYDLTWYIFVYTNNL